MWESKNPILAFIIAIIAIIVIVGGYVMAFYNWVVWSGVQISAFDAQVKNMYERRVDLIPQVAATVKKYMQYEKSTLEEIVKLREASNNLDKLEWLIQDWKVSSEEASNLLASTISQIKVTMEAYPDLKADTSFAKLITEIEWSENRIRVAIMDYNQAVAAYNTKIKTFPGNTLAWYFNFTTKDMMNPPASKDIKAVPNVDNLLDTSK